VLRSDITGKWLLSLAVFPVLTLSLPSSVWKRIRMCHQAGRLAVTAQAAVSNQITRWGRPLYDMPVTGLPATVTAWPIDLFRTFNTHNVNSFVHSFRILTTGTQPLPNRLLHAVRSSASSFNFGILSFPWNHPIATNVFFLAFPSLRSFPLSFLQSSVLEGSSYARCDQSS